MKIAVSCAGRFHAFQLVEQLQKRGALSQFLTTTLNARLIPNRELPDSLKSDPDFLSKVVTIPLPEYLCYGIRKLPTKEAQSLAYLTKDNLFDLRAAGKISASDIFVGWANQSLFQLREAKTRGALGVIERGSTHIEYQYNLLDEECRKLGLTANTRNTYDQRLIEKQLKEYHEADHIMVPSEFARRSFATLGFPKGKVLKVPYGIDLERFATLSRSQNRTGPLRILFIGPLGVQKGIFYLLEAIKGLATTGRSIELTVIGQIEEGFKTFFLRSGLNRQITKHITQVPNRDLPEYFAQNDLLCLPSIQEGLALVIGEAMASGLAIIASDHTGGEEFVRGGVDGFIVPVGSIEALQEKIDLLASDRELLSTLQSNAAERAKEFSWGRYGERIIETYTGLLENKLNPTATEKEEIGAYYDEYWDKEKGWTPSHRFTDLQLKLHFENAFKATDQVLDVGCGDAGNYQSWLVGKVAKLSAIDISQTGITRATAMGLDAHVHDLSKPFPFASNSFDSAICIEVLEHLYDPKFCVQEIFRVLKPGGLFISSVPNNGYFRERLKMLFRAELSTSITDFANEWKGAHIRFYSKESFSRMLEVSGFWIESIRSNGDASIFDGFDALGGYITQQTTTMLRAKLPSVLKLGFLQNIWPSAFAPHIIVWARKPLS